MNIRPVLITPLCEVGMSLFAGIHAARQRLFKEILLEVENIESPPKCAFACLKSRSGWT